MKNLLRAGLFAVAALAQGAFAQTGYLVTVDTTSVSGEAGNIDLQFNPGLLTSENACVNIGYFATDGSLGTSPTLTGNATGALSTSVIIANGSGGCTTATTYTSTSLNDYNQPITFGSKITFFVAFSGPGVTSPNTSTYTSGSSFGLAFTSGDGSTALLTTDSSKFAGAINLNLDGTQTPKSLSSTVTIQSAELVTVGTSASGLSFSIDGASYSASTTLPLVIASNHTLATTSPQPGGTGTEYAFSQWSDNTTSTTDNITVSSAVTTYTAQFNTEYLLTTAASPPADGSVVVNTTSPTSDGYYTPGTPVSITANPNTGYKFSSWTGNVANANNASTTVTMSGPETVTANFVENDVAVTLNTSPQGLLVSVNGGTAQAAPLTVNLQVGSTPTIATTSPQPGATGVRYTWANWSDSGAISHQITVPGTATSYTATFTTSYLLTTGVSPVGDGSVTVSTASPTSDGYYASGTPVSITANPNTGYKFSSWTGAVASQNSASTTVTMSAPETVTATLVVNDVPITINTSPSGLLVSVDGGTAQAGPLNESWQVGSNHTIATSSPQAGATGVRYTWTSWSDTGAISHQITVPSSAATYTANFSTSYLLTTAVNPPGGGTVTVTTASPTSDGYYPAGTPVSLSESPSPLNAFTGWSGNNPNDLTSASTNPTTVNMNAPETVTANFMLTYTLISSSVSVTETGLLYSPSLANPGSPGSPGGGTTTFTLKNTSGSTITGPIQLVLTNLPSGVTGANNTGTFMGSPYWTVPNSSSLANGASLTVTVQLNYASTTAVSTTPAVYTGSV